ncbi:hypothetical protein STEG23_033253, partial [Scotinomys teguina]
MWLRLVFVVLAFSPSTLKVEAEKYEDFLEKELILECGMKKKYTRQKWCMPLIPPFMRKNKEDICEFKANLFYSGIYDTMIDFIFPRM